VVGWSYYLPGSFLLCGSAGYMVIGLQAIPDAHRSFNPPSSSVARRCECCFASHRFQLRAGIRIIATIELTAVMFIVAKRTIQVIGDGVLRRACGCGSPGRYRSLPVSFRPTDHALSKLDPTCSMFEINSSPP
jgi:hypothetical protein